MAPNPTNTAGSIGRITKEIAEIQTNEDLSIAVACRDSDVRRVRGLIIGPPETPYEFGFFEFEIKFGQNYPNEAPTVRCITTNGGRTRFNPNIYAQGKVCLSILGTWRGESGEQWSSAQGLGSLLISIQSLMSSNPYENEPGFEEYKIDNKDAKAYAAKIKHETLRISVVERLERLLKVESEADGPVTPSWRELVEYAKPGNGHSIDSGGASTPATEVDAYEYDAEAAFNALDPSPWDPFADMLKRRFLWYYDSYLLTIDNASQEQKDNRAFPMTQFECTSNGMEGTFQYGKLRKRVEKLREMLSQEKDLWKASGAVQVNDANQLATQLSFQFEQLRYKWNEHQHDSSRLELSLPEKDNPFCWQLTLFGKPMTNLDGGIFNIEFTIPPTFPNTQPRAYVLTPLYHRLVSSTGFLCYFPAKEDGLDSHLQAIVAAIEDEQPKYDPRAMVNPEAAGLYWGGEAKRKQYSRKLRRSTQESWAYTITFLKAPNEKQRNLIVRPFEAMTLKTTDYNSLPSSIQDVTLCRQQAINFLCERYAEALDEAESNSKSFLALERKGKAKAEEQGWYGRTTGERARSVNEGAKTCSRDMRPKRE